MPPTPIKPTHKAIKAYYEALKAYARQDVGHESALRSAFQNLLDETGRRMRLDPDPRTRRDRRGAEGKTVRPDGTFRDDYYITRGHWEAKDTDDNLETEIKRKIAKGYPLGNTIFEDTRQAFLYQNGQLAMKADITQPQALADLLNAFFSYTEPAHENFGKAIGEFQERVPDLARGLVEKIQEAHQSNPRFIDGLRGVFRALPQLAQSEPERRGRGRDARAAPAHRAADPDDLRQPGLHPPQRDRRRGRKGDRRPGERVVRPPRVPQVAGPLLPGDRVGRGARSQSFSEKQHFLNTVYERFFQGYSVKVADTHGIVYTPQEIVDFMCASVAEVLRERVRQGLGDEGVNILDPCTGTGNFIVNILRRIPKKDLPRMYREQLFANEVMLLPYYIAALNIEHAYYEQTGTYEPFEGLCFVDTLDLAKGSRGTFGFMTQENVARVEREKADADHGDHRQPAIQRRAVQRERQQQEPQVRRSSTGAFARRTRRIPRRRNKNALSDMYVKFFRWATDRLNGRDGIVALSATTASWTRSRSTGCASTCCEDFTAVYHLAPRRQRAPEPASCRDDVQRVRHSGRRRHHDRGAFANVAAGIACSSIAWRRRCAGSRNLRGSRRARRRRTASSGEAQPDERHTWLVPENAERVCGNSCRSARRRSRLRRR